MLMNIEIDDLRGPEIAELLRGHLRCLALLSPTESMHALDIEALRKPDITFWSTWEGDQLAGCGALKQLDGRHAEVKSMRTAAPFLRKGVASALLRHMIGVARQRGYRRLSLETGSQKEFEPARRLYTRFGFTNCTPFADYIEDPNSVFMTMEL